MGEVLRFVLTVAVVGVGSAVVAWYRRRVAVRQRAALVGGEEVRVTARLRGSGEPYPRVWRRGVLVVGRNVTWRRRFLGEIPLGLSITRIAAADRGARLVAVDGAGQRVELEMTAEQAPMVADALRNAPGQTLALATYREGFKQLFLLWPAIVFVVAILWSVVWGFLWFGGATVQATVLSNEDELCEVVWRAGGRAESAFVDCTSERAGDRVRVRALAAPLDGEAMDFEFSPIVFIGGGVGTFGLGLAGVVGRAVRRRFGAGLDDSLPTRGVTDIRGLTQGSLSHRDVAKAAVARGQLEGWAAGGATSTDWGRGRLARFVNGWRFYVLLAGVVAALSLWHPAWSALAIAATIGILAAVPFWVRRNAALALQEVPVGAAFVLLPGHDERPVVLLYRASDTTPWAVADLTVPVPLGVPIFGDCRVYRGRRVVIETPGRRLGVTGFAEIEDLDFLRSLVDANFRAS